jgi:hypothetical protein
MAGIIFQQFENLSFFYEKVNTAFCLPFARSEKSQLILQPGLKLGTVSKSALNWDS